MTESGWPGCGLSRCKQGLEPLRVLRPLLAELGVCVPEALGVVTGYRESVLQISIPRKGRPPRDTYRSISGEPWCF